MIKIDDKGIQIKGNEKEILSELSMIVHTLVEEDDVDVNLIDMAVDLGKMNDKELNKTSKGLIKLLEKLEGEE